MNTAKRDKIILSVLAIIIIGVIMFYAAIRPSMNEIESLNKEISSARESIDGLKGKSHLINNLKKQLEELESEVKTNEGDMADFDDYALYLSDFQDITDSVAAGTWLSFNGVAASEKGHYVVVQAGISFTCGYNDLKSIMSAFLENHVHCYNVSISEIGAADNSDPENPVDTQVSVEFTAEYFSRNGLYTSKDYDFTSGSYGLTALFDGTAIVEAETDVDADVEATE